MSQVTGLSASLSTLSGNIATVSASVSAMSSALTGVTQNAITKSTGTFSSITVGGSNVALVGHSHSASDITGIVPIQFLSSTAFDALATKDPNTIYFVDDNSIYKGSELYGAARFDTLQFSTISAQSITVDGRNVMLEGDVVGGTSSTTLNSVGITVTIASDTAVPSVTLTGVGAAASKSVVTASTSMTGTYGSYLPTVTAVKNYVDSTKASKGIATAASFKGLRASVSLKSDAAPTMTFFNDSIVTVSTNMANNAANDKFITASAVAAYVNGKLDGVGGVSGGTATSNSAGVFVSVGIDESAVPYVGVSVDVLTSMDDNSVYSNSLVTASAIAMYIDNKVSAAIESALGVILSSTY